MPEVIRPHQLVIIGKDDKRLTPARKNKQQKSAKRAKLYTHRLHNIDIRAPDGKRLILVAIEIKIMIVE